VLYNSLFNTDKKKLAVLIDPDKQDLSKTALTAKKSQEGNADMILIGGSLISGNIDVFVDVIKQNTNLPVVLFPGSILQISPKADGILLLSLISGRNPDLLIGNHVLAAPYLKKSSLEIISVGYILIDGGKKTSVEYMSNTKPIPADKPDIIVATAMAGEMLGNKAVYLEAGSGALNHVRYDVIKKVKENIDIPLIVGGGIKDTESVNNICQAGANVIVIGNAFEKRSDLIRSFADIIHGEV